MQLDALSPAVDILTSELGPETSKEGAVEALGKAVNVSIYLLIYYTYVELSLDLPKNNPLEVAKMGWNLNLVFYLEASNYTHTCSLAIICLHALLK